MSQQQANPKISVIIPVYNVRDYVSQCLESVLAQSHRHLQVIVVDDGSSDGSGRICDEFAARDPRITVIHQTNAGQAVARNAALNMADGEFIGFADADDWLEPHMFSHLISAVQEHGCGAAVCGYRLCKPSGSIVCGVAPVAHLAPGVAMQELFADRWLKNFMWNKLFRRELFNELRFPAGRFFEELLVMYQLLERSGGVAICPYVGYNYRIRKDSTIGARRISTELDACENHMDRYADVSARLPELEGALWASFTRCLLHTLYISVQNPLPEQKKSRKRRKRLSSFLREHQTKALPHLGLLGRCAYALATRNTYPADLAAALCALILKVWSRVRGRMARRIRA